MPIDLPTDRRTAQRLTAHHTGVVITVYFRQESTVADGIALLGDTVESYCAVVADPAHIVLSVDGPGPGRAVAESVAQEYSVQAVYSETNRGKLAAARLGIARLLENADLVYVALVDQDGDHFANELLNFVRMAGHVVMQTQNENVLVMGSRLSRRRSMGLLRAEGEELASRILLDALQFHAAQTGAPLPLQYLLPLESVPDFHAGYKLFSRRVAHAVFTGAPQLAACPPDSEAPRAAPKGHPAPALHDAYFRHAIEAVMVVEAVHAGATLAAVSRRAYDEQPISLFAHLDRARLTADLIIWPCKRLNVPGPFVAQWLANHLPCLALATLLPEGREELLAIARLVHEAFHLPPPDESLPRPRFI